VELTSLIVILVGVLFALEVTETAISTHAAWFFLVSGWGDPVAALGSPWSICTTIILTGISELSILRKYTTIYPSIV
jgi:hypothetical protein